MPSPSRVKDVLVDEIFEQHRSLLFGVAYRIMGSVADAEGPVQDAWLQWAKVDPQRHACIARTGRHRCVRRRRQGERRPPPALRADHVARWLIGVLAKPVTADVIMQTVDINGEPGFLASVGGIPVGAMCVEIDGERIQGVRMILNPHKLNGLRAQPPVWLDCLRCRLVGPWTPCSWLSSAMQNRLLINAAVL
jgi:hypothetical protein